MIDSLTIEGYRAIETLTLHPRRINLLVGANNSGKTSILEILSLLCTSTSEFIDNTGMNSWNALKKYELGSLIHTGSSHSSISINSASQEMRLIITENESGYVNREIGGKITSSLLQLSESYLLSTDILRNIIQQRKRSKTSASYDVASFDLGTFDVPHDEIEDELESTIINKIKENIIQFAFQSPKITIQVVHQNKLAYLFADIQMIDYLRTKTPGFYSDTAGIEKIISGLRLYYQQEEIDKTFPAAIRMRAGSEVQYLNILFEKMLSNGSIRSLEKIIQDRIPYVEDIRKSEEKGILVYLKGESAPRSLTSMGDGFIALVELLAINTLVKKGIIIMEEPENNLHPGFIDVFAEQVIKDPSENQYFISTHSSDLIETILERAKHTQKLQDIRLVILHKHMHLTYPIAEEMSGEEALEEIESIHSDLRGI
jgi:AAA15 family ATPase/GTPase